MQTNELQDFAGCRHGDLVGTLGGYLGHKTACGGRALPPTLEGFPPVPHFFAAFGCHGAPSSPRLVLVSDVSSVSTSSPRSGMPWCIVEVCPIARDLMCPERDCPMAGKKRPPRRPPHKPSFASRHPQPSTADALVYTEYDITEPMHRLTIATSRGSQH